LADAAENLTLPPRVVRLTPLAEARALMLERAHPVAPKRVPLATATGHISAAAILAAQPVPVTPIALRDGWAVRAADTIGASPYTPCYAAEAPLFVAMGDRIPASRDAVLPMHAVKGDSRPAEILSPAAPREGVREAGGDLACGTEIVARGTRLRPDHIALLALAGTCEIEIRAPTLLILASVPDEPVATMLADLAKAEGADSRCKILDHGCVQQTLKAELTAFAADIVFVIGATGFGATDFSAAALAGIGELLAYGIALRPCETACIASIGTTSVLFVPARLEAALAAWLLLGRDYLDRLSGFARLPRGACLPLTRKIASAPGLSEFVLLRRDALRWDPLATGDLPWSAVAQAEAYHVVPPELEGYAAGETIFADDLT